MMQIIRRSLHRKSYNFAPKYLSSSSVSSSSSVPVSSIQQRSKSSYAATSSNDEIYEQAQANAQAFDNQHNYHHERMTVPHCVRTLLTPIRPVFNQDDNNGNETLKTVPSSIPRPPYAEHGNVPQPPPYIIINEAEQITSIRNSARLARDVLDIACSSAKAGMTTNEIDDIVHNAIIERGAYPSPLNYAEFPKSVCSSVNEVICHGIPDDRVLRRGDLASFDVSCFFEGFHGDNCGTIIIGDNADSDTNKTTSPQFTSQSEEQLFITGRRMIQATQEALDAAISTVHDGSCLTSIGSAISSVCDAYGYSSVEKYRGHGIGEDFHCAPFVKHFRNEDYLTLKEGMVFTIEPMVTEGRQDCVEWASDGWTVVTRDGGRAAQFEHMVAVTSDGAEILTLPTPKDE